MSVRIISHVYAQTLPQYAQLLRYQLSSLILYPPSTEVRIVICYTSTDRRTVDVLNWFRRRTDAGELQLTALPLRPNELFRRAIGRNRASLGCSEDIVWFTDVDHCFGKGCIDDAVEQFRRQRARAEGSTPGEQGPPVLMIYPRSILVSRDGPIGDAAIERASGFCDIEPSEFMTATYSRAIGGVQIVHGPFAAEHGYLDRSKWQRPVEQPFRNFGDDVAYRRFCLRHGTMQPVSLRNLYRIRHSQRSHCES